MCTIKSVDTMSKKYFCENCLNPFSTEDVRDKHSLHCKLFDPLRSVFPKPGNNTLKFNKFRQQFPIPYFAVADFEALQVPLETGQNTSNTTRYAKHVPYSAAYYIVSTDAKYSSNPKMFKGLNCVRQFLDCLKKDVDELIDVIKHPLEMNMTAQDQIDFENSTHCHICHKPKYDNQNLVRDHDHITGCYRGAAHSYCNLNYGIKADSFKMPIFFHNLKGYDAHFIMQNASEAEHGKISAIPKSSEQYISLTVGKMVFKDSLAFTNKNLDNLVKTLYVEELKHTQEFIRQSVVCSPSTLAESEIDVTPTSINDSKTRKRKTNAKKSSAKRIKSHFINDQADTSSGSEDEYEEDLESDLDDFIDDSEHEIDTGFYRSVDNFLDEIVQEESSPDQILYSVDQLPDQDYRKKTPAPSLNLTPNQQQLAEERFYLVQRKGVFPYEYFNDMKRFEETQLPSIEHFYSSISYENISTDEYAHAQKVFQTFDMCSLEEYHDLYLFTDVLLLADVLVSHRMKCIDWYNLDPFHSFTAPGYAWQAALKMTDVELNLITDIDIHQFFEKAMRGGISVISHRHAEADEKTSLLYVDANNLHGWAMSKSLPTGNFKWMPKEHAESFDVESIPDDSPLGYALEVDLEYPK